MTDPPDAAVQLADRIREYGDMVSVTDSGVSYVVSGYVPTARKDETDAHAQDLGGDPGSTVAVDAFGETHVTYSFKP